jgi:hypothetical protein
MRMGKLQSKHKRLVGNLKARQSLKDLDIDERIILKLFLKK